jgi:hypothetical protein
MRVSRSSLAGLAQRLHFADAVNVFSFYDTDNVSSANDNTNVMIGANANGNARTDRLRCFGFGLMQDSRRCSSYAPGFAARLVGGEVRSVPLPGQLSCTEVGQLGLGRRWQRSSAPRSHVSGPAALADVARGG